MHNKPFLKPVLHWYQRGITLICSICLRNKYHSNYSKKRNQTKHLLEDIIQNCPIFQICAQDCITEGMSTHKQWGEVCWNSVGLWVWKKLFTTLSLPINMRNSIWKQFLPHFSALWGYHHLIKRVSLTFRTKKYVCQLPSIWGLYSMKESYSNKGDLKSWSLNWNNLLLTLRQCSSIFGICNVFASEKSS